LTLEKGFEKLERFLVEEDLSETENIWKKISKNVVEAAKDFYRAFYSEDLYFHISEKGTILFEKTIGNVDYNIEIFEYEDEYGDEVAKIKGLLYRDS
jgi:hypothetical protein